MPKVCFLLPITSEHLLFQQLLPSLMKTVKETKEYQFAMYLLYDYLDELFCDCSKMDGFHLDFKNMLGNFTLKICCFLKTVASKFPLPTETTDNFRHCKNN